MGKQTQARKVFKGASLGELSEAAGEWMQGRSARRTRRALRSMLKKIREKSNDGVKLPEQLYSRESFQSSLAGTAGRYGLFLYGDEMRRRRTEKMSLGVIAASAQQLSKSRARLQHAEWLPPECVWKLPLKDAASTISKAAKKRRVKKDVAADVIAEVMRRRRARKQDLAAKLLQWTWKRRRGLRRQCAVGFKVDFGVHATTCSIKYRGVTWPLTRPIPRCLYGANLATQTEFDAQKKEADKVLAHWELYVKIFHRMAKRALVVGDLCCSQGGASIGIRRLQAIPVGADIEYQQQYVDNFGEGSFVQADATNEDIIAQLSQLEAVGALKELDGLWASPPCQGSS